MSLFSPKAILRLLAAALVVGLAGGCSHYHLGPTGKLDFHTLYVAPVRNQSYAAQVQAPVSEMLRQSLLQEGNLQLVNQADADATLEVVLSDYQHGIAATQQSNSLNAQSYDLTLVATCTLVDNRSGNVYFKDRKISATEEVFVQSNDSLAESEYQSIPKLARDLGLKIKDSVVSTW